MNAIAAHKDELEKLLENLSGDVAVSGITFVALLDAYITRLDASCSDISARVIPPSASKRRITYGTDIDSELRALLRATQNFKTAHRAFPKISVAASRRGLATRRQLANDELFRRLPLNRDNGC